MEITIDKLELLVRVIEKKVERLEREQRIADLEKKVADTPDEGKLTDRLLGKLDKNLEERQKKDAAALAAKVLSENQKMTKAWVREATELSKNAELKAEFSKIEARLAVIEGRQRQG